MAKRWVFGSVASIGVALLTWGIAQAGSGIPQVDAKLQANKYNVKLVQAFDECDTAGATVTTVPGTGLLGCPDGDLDGTHFNLGKVIVKFRVVPSSKDNIIVIMKSSGASPDYKKALAGKNLALKLVLRISETTTEALGSVLDGLDKELQVTFADQEVTCPASTVPTNGNLVQKFNLVTCKTPALLPLPAAVLANDTNKEIVSAAVIDSDTGLAIAAPGVRKKL